MKDFKQNTKMACEGNHYNSGGKIKKMAAGGSSRNINEIVSKSTGVPFSKSTPTPVEKNKPISVPSINQIVRRSTGESNYVEPKETIPKNQDTTTTPNININDIVKGHMKKGGKVKRGNK